MATIEDKIQSVKTNAAATNPYDVYRTKLDVIVPACNAITLVNTGDQTNGVPPDPLIPGDTGTPSDYEQIEQEWISWLAKCNSFTPEINAIMDTANAHYQAFWNHENLNYKNRPALLSGVHKIRINVAIEDGGGDTLTDPEKQVIADAQHNDLIRGTISFQEDSYIEIQTLIDSAILTINSITNPILAAHIGDVTTQEVTLSGVSTHLSNIATKLDQYYAEEKSQHQDSLAYATAYGAVMFADNNEGDPVVDSLMGNLP